MNFITGFLAGVAVAISGVLLAEREAVTEVDCVAHETCPQFERIERIARAIRT